MWVCVGVVFWILFIVIFEFTLTMLRHIYNNRYFTFMCWILFPYNIYGEGFLMRYTEAKLLHLSKNEKEILEEIKNEVAAAGGDVSLNQLLRDGVALIYNYKNEIVERYTPKSIKELVKNDRR